MNRRPENNEFFRRCRICKDTKPLDNIHFYNEKCRPAGLSYVCRPCESIRSKEKLIRHPRVYLRKYLTEEQSVARRKSNRKYSRKTRSILKSYMNIDKKKGDNHICDLTLDFLDLKILNNPCVYCGDTQDNIGCDRIDNSIGHLMSNVVPCCRLCNVTRMHNYTHEEMKELGKIIMNIKLKRRSTPHYEI